MNQEMLTEAQLLQQRQKLHALQLDLEQLLTSGSDAEAVECLPCQASADAP